MSNGVTMPPVAPEERLARFILFSRWIRGGNQAVKQDAFVPHPYRKLSVTRHLWLSEPELWTIGQAVADARPATLYGRADLTAAEVRRQELEVEATSVLGNTNHADIVGWPEEKSAQKIVAQELAAAAHFVPNPVTPLS